MRMTQVPDRDALIDQLVQQARGQVAPELSASLESFIRQYYAGLAVEDLLEHDIADLSGALMSHWTLAQRRRPGERLLRIQSPHTQDHGWQSSHTIIEIVQDDKPFLVDSTRLELNRHGLTVHLIVHPVMRVRRDARGQLLQVLPATENDETALQESLLSVAIDRQTNRNVLSEIETALQRVFADVDVCVEDWQPMRNKLRDIVTALQQATLPLDANQLAEDIAFLKWLDQEHFTFIGYREYLLDEVQGEHALRVVPGSSLGILRRDSEARFSRSFSRLQAATRRKARDPELLILTKSNSRATVHRPGYLDYIGIKQFNAHGKVLGEHRFLGLYTSAAYVRRPTDIPLLRRKVQEVMKRSETQPHSHSAKALLNIMETLPRDELFQCTVDELLSMATSILHLQERQRVRVIVRPDTYGRFVSCLVYIPRDRFNTDARLRVQEMLVETFHAEEMDFTVWLTESVLARLHLILHLPPGEIPPYDQAELERRISATVRTWEDDLRDELIRVYAEEQGNRLFARYRQAFPASYRGDYGAEIGVLDIAKMEALHAGDELGMVLYHPRNAAPEVVRFKLFRFDAPVSLSVLLPMLENMGLRVVDERPHCIRPGGKQPIWLHDIGMHYTFDGQLDTEEVQAIFQMAFAQVWSGASENDGLNSLVLQARMSWREVGIIRACARYLRQTGFPFTPAYMEQALTAHAQITRMLADLFLVRFDPAQADKACERAEQIAEAIGQLLDAVPVLDEDRILRRFFVLIQAMLRTNYFQTTAAGEPKSYLSFKLDPQPLPDLPEPRPRYEIFVYSPRVEGVHLRGGKVARGGIRWSDRLEDFRTEIFGLMKAQMVKNAVIVPVGAKGGFVMKRPPPQADREALFNEVLYCYRTFIQGLLDLTDNLQQDQVMPPPEVVRYDDDDPYLVVAADKGTASFSDTANAIAREYGYWLDDAFASGGSTGYDHKKMGITARGVWESVKRHFRELDKDIQHEDFTVVGIGDMSGDVFGNGMLLSQHIKLIGAFSHRDIFLDPNPDPERSFAERLRLFKLPHSTWADYDRTLLSTGGGIHPRTAKSIPISPQMREVLQVDAASLTPNELVSALLQAPVELLWNGGIGTFVKAGFETHADAGDRGNDAVRVDAAALRCKIIGEGGNLGLTYAARIEYAQQGGRLNTDFIDNAGGVDCSDHEVNIKILLNRLIADGLIDEPQRNILLVDMTEEVAQLVLSNNYQQSECLSLSEHLAPQLIDEHARLLRAMERTGLLERANWYLPDEETMAARRAAHQGLTRPELAVLLAYSKIALYQQLLDSDVLEVPYLLNELPSYFPQPIVERYGDRLQTHRLRRELIATFIANNLINRMGLAFVFRIQEHSGAEPPEIACAYLAVRRIFDLPALWRDIALLDNKVPAAVQIDMLNEIQKLINRSTLWLLRHTQAPADIGTNIGTYLDGISELRIRLPEVLTRNDLDEFQQQSDAYQARGVSLTLAMQVGGLRYLFSALEIVGVANHTRQPPLFVAQVFHRLGAELELHWLRDHITSLAQDDHWWRLARSSLRDDQYHLQGQLTRQVLRNVDQAQPAEAVIEKWLQINASAVERFRQRMTEFKTGSADVALISIALDEVRKLISRADENVQDES